MLALPIFLYLSSALALPEPAGDGPVDLRANYYAHAGWFFGCFGAVVVASFVRPLALGDPISIDADRALHVVFLAGAVGAAVSRRPRFHEVLALAFGALLALYVFGLFIRLR